VLSQLLITGRRYDHEADDSASFYLGRIAMAMKALAGHVIVAPDGVRGFDTAQRVTSKMARAFFDHGYRYAVRYVRRDTPHPERDLNAAEASALLTVGLGLMVVQYVESEDSWAPSGDKGAKNGEIAGVQAAKVGVPSGVMLWCDLEGVAPKTPAADVIAYCNRWHQAVASAGFLPGLYVGWRCGLNAKQLYEELRFTHYWAAYNLNADEAPAVRGVQMKQSASKPVDTRAGVGIAFQTDVVRTDALGGRPTVVAPENWLEV
jgi:hypothetical protein